VTRKVHVARGHRGLDGLGGGPRDVAKVGGLRAQRQLAARDPAHVEQVVHESTEVPELALDHLVAPAHLATAGGLLAQQLHHVPDRGERIAQLVRQHREELVLAPVAIAQRRLGLAQARGRRGQLGRALRDPSLQLLVEPLELPGLAVEVGEHAHARAQDLGLHRHADVVHRAALEAAQAVDVAEVHGGDEDDRRALVARVLADHRRQLEAVQLRHAHVDQHHGDVRAQQMLERLLARAGLDQGLPERGEDGLVAQELPRLVVHEQDVDRLARPHRHASSSPPRHRLHLGASISGGATSAARRAAARC
jgi:hypothetical protein